MNERKSSLFNRREVIIVVLVVVDIFLTVISNRNLELYVYIHICIYAQREEKKNWNETKIESKMNDKWITRIIASS